MIICGNFIWKITALLQPSHHCPHIQKHTSRNSPSPFPPSSRNTQTQSHPHLHTHPHPRPHTRPHTGKRVWVGGAHPSGPRPRPPPGSAPPSPLPPAATLRCRACCRAPARAGGPTGACSRRAAVVEGDLRPAATMRGMLALWRMTVKVGAARQMSPSMKRVYTLRAKSCGSCCAGDVRCRCGTRQSGHFETCVRRLAGDLSV